MITRFPLGDEKMKIATLQLESEKRLNQDERRIDWLLQQISENMQHAKRLTRKSTSEFVTEQNHL